jgi:predicted SprT family Zn-dependent metalloprotease
MQVSPVTTYLKDSEIEARACAMLDLYGEKVAPIVTPPVPVEGIADFLLELNLSWLPIRDRDDEPVLAYIDAPNQAIMLNERRRATHFDLYEGVFEYTLGHEVGHYDLHVIKGGVAQRELDIASLAEEALREEVAVEGQSWQPTSHYLCRTRAQSKKPPREYQADLYASYLLMPEHLLIPAVEGINILNWTNLYELRKQFAVSISALTNRLNGLGLLYVAANKKLYRSEAEANGQLRLF